MCVCVSLFESIAMSIKNIYFSISQLSMRVGKITVIEKETILLRLLTEKENVVHPTETENVEQHSEKENVEHPTEEKATLDCCPRLPGNFLLKF